MTWHLVLTDWTFEPTVVVPLAVAATVYAIGVVRSVPRAAWQMAAFFGGLLTILVALQSPVDALDDQLFWVHMLQHLLLIMVAAPLILLGDPLLPMLRAWPLRSRRRTLRAVASSPTTRGLCGRLAQLANPWFAGAVLVVDLYFWHVPPVFDLTLQNAFVHYFEHFCFLSTALLFWSQVIDMRAVHNSMSYLQRAIFVAVIAAAGNLLSMYLVFASRPLYSGYADLHPRPYGLAALADQQYAGALMWVPVLFVFSAAFCLCLYRWLGVAPDNVDTQAVPSYSLLDGSLASDSSP